MNHEKPRSEMSEAFSLAVSKRLILLLLDGFVEPTHFSFGH